MDRMEALKAICVELATLQGKRDVLIESMNEDYKRKKISDASGLSLSRIKAIVMKERKK